MSHITLNMPLAGGWKALKAQFDDVGSSCIALLTIERGANQKHTRIDLGKRMLIDRVPTTITHKKLNEIVGRILKAS